ncbi:calponin homology domain-containing protein [Blastocladiella britannica]|nr:calponin homology domain-containing protein [Blastocladiella britannica]
MSESRQDLLRWVNQLLQLNLTKIEELGKGYALCQVFDSIYGDVPLKRVKFAAKQEFEYIQNFKVLQACFDKHKIPNAIPVERLVKLKMQDNLEFCQFVKKFWDGHFPGWEYDAQGRRGGVVMAPSSAPPAGAAPRVPRVKSSPMGGGGMMASSSLGSLTSGAGGGASAAALHHAQSQVMDLEARLAEAQASVDSMLKERDFYFNKLRSIEVSMQGLQQQGQEVVTVADVLAIMYAADEPAIEEEAGYDAVHPDEIESF